MSLASTDHLEHLRHQRTALFNSPGRLGYHADDIRRLDQQIADAERALHGEDGPWRIGKVGAYGHVEPCDFCPRFQTGREAQAWLDAYEAPADLKAAFRVMHLPTRQSLAALTVWAA